jgi:YidC/Oxa1 family membrane protein insertase
MKTEVRFLLAIFLMLGVLVGTNLLFPPIVPEEALLPDSTGGTPAGGAVAGGSSAVGPEAATDGTTAAGVPEIPTSSAPVIPDAGDRVTVDATVDATAASERRIAVEAPLYRYEFSNYGARLMSAQMSEFEALNREGVVDLVQEESAGYWGQKLLVGTDTVDLSRVPFTVEPADGLTVSAGAGTRTLRFTYEHPTSPFAFVIEYDFNPDDYTVVVRGSVEGDLDRPLLLTDLGEGLTYSEADSVGESRTMALVSNHVQEGIESTLLSKAEPTIVEGPLLWAAFKSKFFVMALLAGETEQAATESSYLGGLIVQPTGTAEVVRVAAAQPLTNDGGFAYRVFVGPQQYALLSSLGQGMEEVNPYGWKFFQPVVRPIVSVIMTIFEYLHTKLSVGYGWVLIIFGVMMRVVLFPLNHKAMKAQLRNMAVQPLLQEIQKKYKDQPEKLQKEMMRLYKEHGFNPLAGCLPMLIPWPVLIALFFVFQNTIELRGEAFLWMPDLSAPDPLYLLPVFLGLSMFLMQYVSYKSLDTENPQMKMMMYLMPIMMVFIFFRLASGLNLYYATANIATIPQQVWISRERMKMKGKPPPKMKSD